MYTISYGTIRPRLLNRPLSGIISWLVVDWVVPGPPEPVPAFGAAEQAVVAFTLKSVTALYAHKAFGDLLADQVGEQTGLMTA